MTDIIQGSSPTEPTAAQKEARRIVEMFMNTRLEICTKLDSVFQIISDYPTLKTCKELAILHVKGILNYVPDGQESAYLQSILSEIEKM